MKILLHNYFKVLYFIPIKSFVYTDKIPSAVISAFFFYDINKIGVSFF